MKRDFWAGCLNVCESIAEDDSLQLEGPELTSLCLNFPYDFGQMTYPF